jgi:hypothetical protein
LTRKITRLQHSKNPDGWQYASLRAQLDARILTAYGAKESDVQTILADFPLIDQRGRRSLAGNVLEPTKDLILQCLGIHDRDRDDRLAEARRIGIEPYVPAEFSGKGLKQRRPRSGNPGRTPKGTDNVQLREENHEG